MEDLKIMGAFCALRALNTVYVVKFARRAKTDRKSFHNRNMTTI
jgi:hypothetical protein